MTAAQRILACIVAGILWLAAIVAKHFFPDIDIGGFVLACGSVIAGVGVHGVATGGSVGQLVTGTAAPTDRGQGGFASVRLLAAIAGLALGLLMLAGCAAAPTGDQVQALRNACAVDAGLRPSVTVLLAIPGIAKPEELAAVAAARAVIDPVCANPGGDVQANSVAAVTSASATLVGIAAEMQARKAAAK